MSPNDIYKSLTQIRDNFPKPSSMVVAFISTPGTKGTFDNAFERTIEITAKSGFSLENKQPTQTYAPTDTSVIDYLRTVAEGASQSRTNVLVVIDLNIPLTSVWVTRGSACFIATAAYGSTLAPEVVLLGRFRDDILMVSNCGRLMVRLYYYFSPPLASAIASNWPARFAVRNLLRPIIRVVKPGLEFVSKRESKRATRQHQGVRL